jgi:hypothetical protein
MPRFGSFVDRDLFGGPFERGFELLLVYRIRQRLEELERPEPAAKHGAPFRLDRENTDDVRPALADVTQELEPRAIAESFAGDEHIEMIGAQEIDARGFGRCHVHFEHARDRFEHLWFLVGNQHPHRRG